MDRGEPLMMHKRKHNNPKGRKTHGKTGTKEHQTWIRIKSRCNPKVKYYGERGIRVCERWINSFEDFYNDMGKAPSKKHTIDRIDTNGNYEPSNCRWATPKEQQRNRRINHTLKLDGAKKCIAEWSEEKNIGFQTIHQRKKRGWSDKKALTKPVQSVERLFSIFGLTLSLKDWGKLLNINYRTLNSRLNSGWSVYRAFTTITGNNGGIIKT